LAIRLPVCQDRLPPKRADRVRTPYLLRKPVARPLQNMPSVNWKITDEFDESEICKDMGIPGWQPDV
jgi:hypothetical protein